MSESDHSDSGPECNLCDLCHWLPLPRTHIFSSYGLPEEVVSDQICTDEASVGREGVCCIAHTELLMYRSTPHTVTGVLPAELFLKRQMRTQFSLLKPSLAETVEEKQQTQNRYRDKGRNKLRALSKGDCDTYKCVWSQMFEYLYFMFMLRNRTVSTCFSSCKRV